MSEIEQIVFFKVFENQLITIMAWPLYVVIGYSILVVSFAIA